MLVVKESKKLLKESLAAKGYTLTQFYNDVTKVLREDSENIDFSSLQQRCNWLISKIVKDRESLLKLLSSDEFVNNFKNISVNANEDKIILTINGNEITGNTKYLALLLIIYGYALYVTFKSIENFNEVGGLLISYSAKQFAGELNKRCFLSDYTVNGDYIKQVLEVIYGIHPLISLLVALLGMLVIRKDLSKSVRATCLLLPTGIKSGIDTIVGYIAAFVEQSGVLLNLKTELLAKDIKGQLDIAKGSK